VNASSLLGKGQWFHSLRAKKYKKLDLIEVVASDSHDNIKRKVLIYETFNFSFK
jgi:tyrosine-protein phosphatase YwqE